MSKDPKSAASLTRSTHHTRAISRSAPTHTRGRWLRIALLVLVLFGGLSLVIARPVWRRIKAIRAHAFIKEAEAHFRATNWSPGFERTRAAVQLSPMDPVVLRHAAHAFEKLGNDAAFRYYEALIATGTSTQADQEDFAAYSLRLGAHETSRRIVDQLMSSSAPSARTLGLAATHALLRRDTNQAIAFARAAATQEPDNVTNQLLVATVLGQSSDRAELDGVRERLWHLARTNGPHRLAALEAILNLPVSDRTDREQAEAILATMTDRSDSGELLLAEARVSLDPSRRRDVAEAVIDRFAKGTPQQISQAGRWLNRHQLFHRTRDLVPSDWARTNAVFFRLRYDALTGLGDLNEAYNLAMIDRPPGDPLEAERLRYEGALRLKNRESAESHLRTMLNMAKRDGSSLRHMADYALRQGNRAIATAAYEALAKNPRDAVFALRGLVRIADFNGETWTARRYTQQLSTLLPNDPIVILQLAYYNLLLSEELAPSLAAVETLHRAEPSDFNRRAVLALAHLRRGETANALGLVGGEHPDWRIIPTGFRAVMVAVLARAGREDSARELLQTIPLHRLKPEERELVKPLLAGSDFQDEDKPGDDGPEIR